jgi:hypothetical protein
VRWTTYPVSSVDGLQGGFLNIPFNFTPFLPYTKSSHLLLTGLCLISACLREIAFDVPKLMCRASFGLLSSVDGDLPRMTLSSFISCVQLNPASRGRGRDGDMVVILTCFVQLPSVVCACTHSNPAQVARGVTACKLVSKIGIWECQTWGIFGAKDICLDNG